MELGDFHFFIFGITRNTNDFHAVQKRLWHVQTIRRRDEHDVRKIIIYIQIMIIKCIILFRIQHFEKRRRRIPPMIHTHFIHFIKKE